MTPPADRRPLWLRLLGLAFLAHLLFGVQRLETKALPRRLDEIERYRDAGAVAFHLGRWPGSVAALELLRDETPEDAVVLIRGELLGHMELAVGLLAPRLLYAESAVPAGARTVHGRPIARGVLPGRGEGALVLVGFDRETLRLELR